MPSHPSHGGECASFNRRALDFVRHDPTIAVVLLAGFWSAPFVNENQGERFAPVGQDYRKLSRIDSRNNLKLGLSEEIKMLESAGKNVVLVTDNPRFAFDPFRYIKTNSIPLRRLLAGVLLGSSQIHSDSSAPAAGRDEDNISLKVLNEVSANLRGVQVFDSKKALCDEGLDCVYRDGQSLLYVDEQHLSPAGANRALTGLNLLSNRLGKTF
jgi:hypothetical protein